MYYAIFNECLHCIALSYEHELKILHAIYPRLYSPSRTCLSTFKNRLLSIVCYSSNNSDVLLGERIQTSGCHYFRVVISGFNWPFMIFRNTPSDTFGRTPFVTSPPSISAISSFRIFAGKMRFFYMSVRILLPVLRSRYGEHFNALTTHG